MGTSVALIIFGVSLAAGAVIDCDKRGSNTGLDHPIGDYYNIAITNHHPALTSNGIPQQTGFSQHSDLPPNSQISHHGTNIFIKPHLQFSSGNVPMEQPPYGGNNKLDNSLPFVPEYSPEILLTPGEVQLPAQHFIVAAPEPQVVSIPQSPVEPAYQEPIEVVDNKLPAVIPPAPELPALQMPTLPVPVILEDTPMSQQVSLVPSSEYFPGLMVVPAPQAPTIQPVVEDAIENTKDKVIPPAPELPPLKMPSLPVPVILEDIPMIQQVPLPQYPISQSFPDATIVSMPQYPISQSLPELIIVPFPQYPAIQPAIEDAIEKVDDKMPLVIPPAPELPPLQLPALPVPVILEDTPMIPQVPMIQPISQFSPEPTIVPLPQNPVIQPVIQDFIEEIHNEKPLNIPAAPELPPLQLPILPVPVAFEEKNVGEPISNLIPAESTEASIVPAIQEVPKVPSHTEWNNEAPVLPALMLPVDVARPEVNQQPFLIAEYPQYPIAYPEAQRELAAPPCPPQYMQQPAGVIQIHQYINSVPQPVQTIVG